MRRGFAHRHARWYQKLLRGLVLTFFYSQNYEFCNWGVPAFSVLPMLAIQQHALSKCPLGQQIQAEQEERTRKETASK
jgi:hypothetical protein